MIFYTIFVVLLEKGKKKVFFLSLSLGGRFRTDPLRSFFFTCNVPKTNVNSLYFFPPDFGLSESVLFTCTENSQRPSCVRRDPRLGEEDPPHPPRLICLVQPQIRSPVSRCPWGWAARTGAPPRWSPPASLTSECLKTRDVQSLTTVIRLVAFNAQTSPSQARFDGRGMTISAEIAEERMTREQAGQKWELHVKRGCAGAREFWELKQTSL